MVPERSSLEARTLAWVKNIDREERVRAFEIRIRNFSRVERVSKKNLFLALPRSSAFGSIAKPLLRRYVRFNNALAYNSRSRETISSRSPPSSYALPIVLSPLWVRERIDSSNSSNSSTRRAIEFDKRTLFVFRDESLPSSLGIKFDRIKDRKRCRGNVSDSLITFCILPVFYRRASKSAKESGS